MRATTTTRRQTTTPDTAERPRHHQCGRNALILLLVLGCSGLSASARAEGEIPARHRILLENTTGGLFNQIGAGNITSIDYRRRLYERPGSLWTRAYLGGSLITTVTPSFARSGVRLDVMPLAVLRVSVGYLYNYSFGLFSSVLSYRSATAEHSDSALRARSDAGENYRAGRHHLYTEALVQAKVGPVALRSKARFTHHIAELQGDDRLFYRRGLDLLIPDRGWVVRSQTDLVYTPDSGLIVGVHLDVAHAFYRDRHFAPGDDRQAVNDTIVRLGPQIGWEFHDVSERFRQPTVLLMANWWLRHRYRTGADVAQAVPFVQAAFRFRGTLWAGN